MKPLIEHSIFNDDNLIELNHFLQICTMVEDETDLIEEIAALKSFGSFDHLEEKGIRYGFGHSHFWLSELQGRGEWVRILFIDFTQTY
jgi:hypothetical protein